MTDFTNPREPTDIDRLIEDAMRDPERAKRILAYQTEIQADQRRYRTESLFRLLVDISNADALPDAERAERLNDALMRVLEDPALSEDLLAEYDSLLDEDDALSESDLAVQEALLNAADPFTGRVPDNFRLSADLQERLEASPDLQAFREALPTMIRGNADERIRTTAERMRRFLQQPRRIIDDAWMERSYDDAEHPLVLVSRSLVFTGPPGSEAAPSGEMQPGDVQVLYAEDADGLFRLGETRILRDDGRFDVRLRLFEPGAYEAMVEQRDEWQIEATLDGTPLALAPDASYPDAWRLAEPLSGEQLAVIVYDVALT